MTPRAIGWAKGFIKGALSAATLLAYVGIWTRDEWMVAIAAITALVSIAWITWIRWDDE